MEVAETPTFWCPHVDRTVCTNFSPRTIELRPSESREILPFPFLLSPFPSFSLYEPFSFYFLFAFLFFFSFLISFPPPFGAHHSFGQMRKFPPYFLKPNVWPLIFPLFLLFLFMTSSPTWLNVSHGIPFPHMAHCEPFFQCQVSISWGAMWHPLTLPCVIRHPTPRKT